MAYTVYATESFEREASKSTKDEQERIKKISFQLKDDPYVGDSLRYRFLREKRIIGKRVYWLVYDDLKAVLVVALSNKKTQQETIDRIVPYFDEYRTYMEKLLKSQATLLILPAFRSSRPSLNCLTN